MDLRTSHVAVAMLSGIVGAGLTVILRPPPSAAVETATGMDHGAVLASIDRRLETMNGLLRTSAARPSDAPSLAGAKPAVSESIPGHREAAAVAVTAEAPAVRRDEAHGHPLPPLNEDRIVQLQPFHKDPASRDEWLFATEERVLRTFGTPTEIELGASEKWKYVVTSGNQQLIRTFQFHRGRVIAVR